MDGPCDPLARLALSRPLRVEFPAHLDEPELEVREAAGVLIEFVEDAPRTGAKLSHRPVVPAELLNAKRDEDGVYLKFDSAPVHGFPPSVSGPLGKARARP